MVVELTEGDLSSVLMTHSPTFQSELFYSKKNLTVTKFVSKFKGRVMVKNQKPRTILSFPPDCFRGENKAVKPRLPPAGLPLLVPVSLGYAGSLLSANGD